MKRSHGPKDEAKFFVNGGEFILLKWNIKMVNIRNLCFNVQSFVVCFHYN